MTDFQSQQLNKPEQQLRYPLDYVSSEIIKSVVGNVYPVGVIYTTTSTDNPSTTFGFGTWEEFAKGRCLVGVDTSQSEFDTIEETGGAKTHTLTVNEMPSHSHTVNVGNTGSGALSLTASGLNNNFQSGAISSSGSGNAHNNLQPYITVYFWKRTA